ncbi:YHYH protein [Caenimonas aquaedulcis]|uniref:YHYH protein n=1 Tax=Caenimonas aquaedulcis TaxID=2793270 RepID=A0A931H5S8_9BURK|nr:YHYH protein [Caenimonas aquaedulcis]MBG9389184.1 YHYH protein [Caenimonas aquaedulcis]
MKAFICRALLLAAAVLSSSCGGGAGDPGANLPPPQSARPAQGMALAMAQRAQQPMAAATLTAAQAMDWAEANYPQLFAPAGQPTGQYAPYTYRYYPGTQTYLAVTASEQTPKIYVKSPLLFSNEIHLIGELSAYQCVVLPATCVPPGLPVIGAATPGNASASIAFSAPTTGGGEISRYDATCSQGLSTHVTGTGTVSPITVVNMTNNLQYSCSVTATNPYGTSGPSGAVSVTPSASTGGSGTGTGTGTGTQTGTVTGTTSTAGVACAINASVLNPTVHITSTVSITCDSTLRTINGNGVPDHATGTFPNAGNPTAIGSVNVHYSNTLTPVAGANATSVAHKVGYANNSVPFDPATAESYQNAGVWKIEALNQSYFPFGTDSSNAHVQPDGAYHYHGMPENYITKLGKGTSTMTLVGFALDGFPIYARYGYVTATDSSSGVKKMTSSWRLKTTPSAGRPSTASVPMGTFTQDYEYVAGLGDLDECNGRTGVTPEFPNGIYHYYITEGYPYIQRCVKGTPSYNGTVGN